MSADTATAWPPSRVIASTVSSSRCCPRATTTTRQPLRPSSSATARPIPCEPPVTTATLPVMPRSIYVSLDALISRPLQAIPSQRSFRHCGADPEHLHLPALHRRGHSPQPLLRHR